jgi:putative flippase GtrA
LIEVMGMDPVHANLPALLAGATVQFVGCRHLVFQATTGPLRRQLAEFGVVELGTLALNAIGFHLLVTITAIPYAVSRVGVSFVVFNGFSHPLWTLVFRQSRAQSTEAD